MCELSVVFPWSENCENYEVTHHGSGGKKNPLLYFAKIPAFEMQLFCCLLKEGFYAAFGLYKFFNDIKETSSYFVIQPLMIHHGDQNLCW